MTPEQFVYWLQGFVEISGKEELSPEQMVIVQDHLKLVFKKVTPNRQPTEQRKCEKTGPAPKHDRDDPNYRPGWPVKVCSMQETYC